MFADFRSPELRLLVLRHPCVSIWPEVDIMVLGQRKPGKSRFPKHWQTQHAIVNDNWLEFTSNTFHHSWNTEKQIMPNTMWLLCQKWDVRKNHRHHVYLKESQAPPRQLIGTMRNGMLCWELTIRHPQNITWHRKLWKKQRAMECIPYVAVANAFSAKSPNRKYSSNWNMCLAQNITKTEDSQVESIQNIVHTHLHNFGVRMLNGG